MLKFKYQNNTYKYDGINFYILAGENNLYISKIVDEDMIEILSDYVETIGKEA
jgi:hypothetical protein